MFKAFVDGFKEGATMWWKMGGNLLILVAILFYIGIAILAVLPFK